MNVDKILADLEAKHPGEKEYLQAVHEVKTKVYPELNEDFFLDLGLEDVKTKEDLEKTIKETMTEQKEDFITKLPKIYSEELLDSLFYEVYTRINYIEERCHVTRQTAATYLFILKSAD